MLCCANVERVKALGCGRQSKGDLDRRVVVAAGNSSSLPSFLP